MMKRMHRKKLSLAVAQALGAGIIVGLTAPSAYAQQPAPVERIEKFNVTGSRIPQANLESTSPITQITAQDIRFEGPVSVENLLNNMPQVIADQGNFVGNGSTGTATVNLRGLGSARTLVLVNGRPLPPGTPAPGGYAADLNEIPSQLIQRVEILTGGASAVYGSDAISGVVNFIMNDRFEGVQVDVSHSFYNHHQHNSVKSAVADSAAANPSQFQVPGDVDSDGEVEDYSLLLGGNFANNKGNATLFLGYHKQQPVRQDQRDFGACSLAATGEGFVCAGSSNGATGRFTPQSGPQKGHKFTIADAAGNVRPFLTSDLFNFNPFNYYQAPDQRWNVNAFAHYDVVPEARVYAEFGFHDSHSPRNIAPGADFGSINTLSFNNPLLSDAFKSTFGITPTNPVDFIIQRRNIEGGPRIFDYRTTSYRGVGGVKGEILGGWNYDLYYELGRVIYQQEFRNDLSISHFTRALDAVKDPATGLPTCRSVLNGFDPNCVPWDIFHLGGVSQAALDFVVTPAFQTGSTERRIYGGTLGADLGMYGWRSPWAKDGIGVSFGVEKGIDKFDLNVDVEFQTGDVEGLPVKANHGEISRTEYFAEVRVPIIEDRPWAQYLAVNGSYRYSDYSINQTANTYGLGVEWNPVKQVKLRGSISQSVRAPNIVELFLPAGLTLFSAQDPCGPNATTNAPPTATLAQCLRTGLPASLYGAGQLASPAGQLNTLQGGNPNLTPETGKSFTAGVVWQPMSNLSATVDYYKVKVNNVISIIPPATALLQCINVGSLCDLIHRDAQGTLWLPGQGFVTGTNVNIAKLETSGVDLIANYTQPLPGAWGSIAVQFNGTYLKDFKIDQGVGLGPYNCAGLYGPICNGQAGFAINPLAKWKHKLRGTWSSPWNVDFSATWRHINQVTLDAFNSDPQLNNPDFQNPEEEKLASRDYLDLALSWAITKQFTLWAGVNNVFDKDPPLQGTSTGAAPTSSNSGNTFPQMYDPLGRRIFVSLTAKF
jgi:iron complex outermembrane receptor protein